MDNSRMSTADMLQYCEEALAWEDFGPIDIFFFESVKKILLGQCSALEEPEDVIDDLMGIERPVRDVELEPEYGKYADIYYGEEGDDDIPDYSRSKEDEAFDSVLSGEGFFDEDASRADESAEPAAESASAPAPTGGYTEKSEGAYTLNENAYSLNESTGTVSPKSVNITVGAENSDLGESEFNGLKESLAAAAAAAEQAINNK